MLISRIEPTLPSGTRPQSAVGWRRPSLSQYRPRHLAVLALAVAAHVALIAALTLLVRVAVLPEPPSSANAVSMFFEPAPAPSAPEAPPVPQALPAAAAPQAPPQAPPEPPQAAAPAVEPPLPSLPVEPPPPVLEPTPVSPAVLPVPPPMPGAPAAEAPPPEPQQPPPRSVVRETPPRSAPVRKPVEARRPVTRPAPAAQEAGPALGAAPPVPSASSSASARSSVPSLGPTLSAAPLPGNSKPPYPMSARRMGEQGRVLVAVSLSASGSPQSVTVATSSGHAVLDEAAVNAIRTWRFRPAERDGQPVASTVEVPVTFHLDSGD